MGLTDNQELLRKTNRRRVLSSMGAFLLVACLAPTMPLPPPARPTIEGPDESGTVVLSGRIANSSQVYVENLSTGYGVSQVLRPDSGAYRLSIQASVGDHMSMYYRRGLDESQAQAFDIPEPVSNGSLPSDDADGGVEAESSANP